MKFTLWIAKRLRMVTGGNKANATGIVIAVCGIAIALGIMEATLGVVLGFKNQITDRVLGFEAPIAVLPAYDYNTGLSEPTIQADSALIAAIKERLPESRPAIALSQPGILKTDSDFAGVYLRAYGAEYDNKFERLHLTGGSLPSDSGSANMIAISDLTANALQLGVGDKVYAYFFVDDAIRQRRLEICGTYSTGFNEYDQSIAYAPLSTLQRIAGIDSISGTSLHLQAPIANIEEQAMDLQEHFIDLYHTGELERLYPVDNARHTGAIFFNWLSLLDTNVVVIFILMACVAAFTLISSMFILILDRVATIGVLRALGASRKQVRLIFTNLAMKAVLLGLLIGNAVALPILLIEEHHPFMPLDPEMYYLPYVPVEINWWWMLILNAAVALIAWLVLLIPARSAARISPATVMRFE